jgi:DNA mismatch repair ATPase MutL
VETIQSFEKMQVVGKGRTQLLFETSFNVNPPMSKIIGESYDVEITDYTVFNDRVLIKGTVEKTLYYKHPHGKKGQNDEADSKKDNNEEADNNEEQSDKKDEESKDDSATSELKKSFHFFSKKRKNARKEEVNNKEEKSEKNKEQKSEKNKEQKSEKKDSESKNNSGISESAEKTDEFKCLNGWGQVLDSSNGIVHFNQQVSEFSGTVEIPGVMPGDYCHVELVEASNCDPFVAAAAASGNNNGGLIEAGTQLFALDVVLVAARTKAEKYSTRRKKKASTLPLTQVV